MVKLERHVQQVRTRLGKNIGSARVAKNMDRKDLAKAIGVDEGIMAEIEAGTHNIPFNTLVRLSRKLRVCLSDLFTEG